MMTQVLGMKSVWDYGARSEKGFDNADAFEAALEAGATVYVPEGEYEISRGLKLINQRLVGEGSMRTRIICTDPSESAAVIRAGRSSVIEHLSIGFLPELITGKEKRGERVGLLTGIPGRSMLQRGSSVRCVRIDTVGTGIYSAREDESESFSVTYDTLEIANFTFRGVDFCALNRTGNVFSNLYIYSHYEADTLFCLETEESEVAIHQLNIEHTRCRYGVRLVGVRAFAISTLHFEGLTLTDPDGAMLHIEGSAGSIESMSVYYCSIIKPDCCMVQLGNTHYDICKDWAQIIPGQLDYVRIGVLHLKGLNDPNEAIYHVRYNGLLESQARGFQFFRQTEGAQGVYRVQIDHYAYYTFKEDQAYYESLPSQGEIDFIRKGQLPSHGSTDRRPTQRLCPYRTQYYDTDLGRMLTWTGVTWV